LGHQIPLYMKYRLFLIALFSSFFLALRAQAPLNDDCSGVFDLGIAPACLTNTFSNVGATPSFLSAQPEKNLPACFAGGAADQRDVWFVFTCSNTLTNYRITLTGTGTNSIRNPQFAVYRGDCVPEGLAEIFCAVSDPGEKDLILDMEDLTPGAQYFIRISDYSATGTSNAGTFNLCVDRIPPIVTIAQGSSTLSSGTLYDSGGPNGDYDKEENYVFTICPNNKPACIEFTLDYYFIEASMGGGYDVLSFYDGNKAAGTPIFQIGGILEEFGGGGVKLPIQASSGCLTVSFLSDKEEQKQGWKGTWKSSDGPCKPEPLIKLDTTANEATIANFVETEFTNVTVAEVKCPRGAYATFAYPSKQNVLELDKGLLLTNGAAAAAFGSGDVFASGVLTTGGDEDLDYLSELEGQGQLVSTDACIVEMDVFIASDELSFEYVFGSEEYPEYVNSEYNDIFAFLVSGPGIVGDPNLGGAKNIAVVPGTNTPIQINSVNNLTNWPYYRNNDVGKSLTYDGLTSDSLGIKKSLTANTKVIPCNTYRLKFAVADRYDKDEDEDKTYDSGVFIANIRGGGPDISARFGSGIDYMIESCSGNLDRVIFKLFEAKDKSATYTIKVGGTATRDVDYQLVLPNTITFQPGETTLSFPITPLPDNLQEGTETITISVSANFGCGEVVFSTLNLRLNDNAQVEITGADTVYACVGGLVQLEATGASDYFWSPPGIFNNAFVANPVFTATEDRWITVTGTIGTCTDMDSVWIDVVDPEIEVKALGDTLICQGESVQLEATNNVNNAGLSWSPARGLVDPLAVSPIAKPTGSTTFKATIALPGCTISDTITILVDTLFMPILASDTTVCQGYPVLLTDSLFTTGGSVYEWTPATGLNDATISQPIATPDQTTTYTLTAKSARGACEKTASVTVTVRPADVEIGPAVRELCLDQTATLNAVVNPGSAATVQWSPSFEVSAPTGASVTATPGESVTIVARYQVNGCTVFDSVRLRVDSLPDPASALAIMADPAKPIYCPGDTIILFSRTYEPASFPDITHEWLPGPGLDPPFNEWNAVLTADTTHTFQRITVNRACRDTSEIVIKVGIIPELMVTAEPPRVCPGGTSRLKATVKPEQKLEWEANSALSCTKCPDPSVTVFQTTTFIVKTPDADCPATGSVTVQVEELPVIALVPEVQICSGDTVRLNIAPPQPGVTYSWTSNPSGFTATTANVTVRPTQVTTYTLVAQGACRTQSTSRVTPVLATINAGADVKTCQGLPVTLNATISGIPAAEGAVLWNPGARNGTPITVTPAATTTFTANLFYGPGNTCRAFDEVLVEVSLPVILEAVSIPPTGDTLCAGTPISIRATRVSPPGTPLQWTQNGSPVTPTGDSLRIVPSVTEGAVTFEVKTANTIGCPDQSRQFTYIISRCFALPNVFTPDGDQVNDTFGPLFFGGSAQVVSFEIYNRWGQKVFSGGQNTQRWNGNVGENQAPTDVYVYKMVIRFPDGNEEPYSGEVTLLR
jgi:gliding motility-associated-like protein